ncbi:MAG: alpha/beta hydrolase [Clostridia bacterium]|nr:alpha/beta hydrolase [Clostridia bacterium]
MIKEIISGRNGYDIPCLNNLSGGEKLAVIISHGFGSSKESPTNQAVSAALPKYGIGTYSFDFPAHGESPVDGRMLRIGNCTGDLADVEAHVHKLFPEAEIAYFSSSFGAYINLIYLATRKHAGRKSFLRCAAVDMPGIFRSKTTPEYQDQLETQGFVMLDRGYLRPLKITREFLADLDGHNVFSLYQPGMAELGMIHGTADETASIDDTRRFARQSGAELIEVKDADHRFLIPGGMEQVIDAAVRFFTNPV